MCVLFATAKCILYNTYYIYIVMAPAIECLCHNTQQKSPTKCIRIVSYERTIVCCTSSGCLQRKKWFDNDAHYPKNQRHQAAQVSSQISIFCPLACSRIWDLAGVSHEWRYDLHHFMAKCRIYFPTNANQWRFFLSTTAVRATTDFANKFIYHSTTSLPQSRKIPLFVGTQNQVSTMVEIHSNHRTAAE